MALVAVLGITLCAGLFPFSWARRNDVGWIPEANGLAFRSASMAVSESELRWDTSSGPAQLAFELWLAPAGPTDDARDILVLLDEPRMPVLLLAQSGVDLIVTSRVTNRDGERWYNDFVFPSVLAGKKIRHLALVSGEPHPLLHLDGRSVCASEGYGIPLARRGTPLAGHLLVGCSPRARTSWRGDLHGLVVHGRAPTPIELKRHDGPLAQVVEDAARMPGVLAAYAFSEGEGRVARNLLGAEAALHFPEYYRPLGAQAFTLTPLGSLAEPHMLVDVVVNIVGFLPLGFLLALLLLSRGRVRPLALVLLVTAAGAGISFAIEWIQVLMPSRYSSLLDFLLNTLGAALGAGIALWLRRRAPAQSA